MTESNVITVEATGETVGEAKWAALRELESLVGPQPLERRLGLVLVQHSENS